MFFSYFLYKYHKFGFFEKRDKILVSELTRAYGHVYIFICDTFVSESSQLNLFEESHEKDNEHNAGMPLL